MQVGGHEFNHHDQSMYIEQHLTTFYFCVIQLEKRQAFNSRKQKQGNLCFQSQPSTEKLSDNETLLGLGMVVHASNLSYQKTVYFWLLGSQFR